MKVKNVSARGWWVGGQLIAPLSTVELNDSFLADIDGNADLEVIAEEVKRGRTAKQEAKEEVIAVEVKE